MHQFSILSTSQSWGSLLIYEAISEAKDNKWPYAAALNVKKAFHTVWHDYLLDKLHVAGLQDHWPIRQNIICNLSISVQVESLLAEYDSAVTGQPTTTRSW